MDLRRWPNADPSGSYLVRTLRLQYSTSCGRSTAIPCRAPTITTTTRPPPSPPPHRNPPASEPLGRTSQAPLHPETSPPTPSPADAGTREPAAAAACPALPAPIGRPSAALIGWSLPGSAEVLVLPSPGRVRQSLSLFTCWSASAPQRSTLSHLPPQPAPPMVGRRA